MRRFVLMRVSVLAAIFVSAVVAGSFDDAQGKTRSTIGCMQASKLKSVFPPGGRAGFAGRDRLKVQPWRGGTVPPDFCGAFWTTYHVRPGEAVDVGVALFKSATGPRRGLAIPAFGPVHRAANGARFRTYEGSANVNGVPAKDTDVESAYRKIGIGGTSISTAGTPVPIPMQLRLHRLIENAFARMQAAH